MSPGGGGECGSHIFESEEQGQLWAERVWLEFMSSILTKGPDWSHEQEYRLLVFGLLGQLDKSKRTLTYDFNSLKGVIFGISTPHDVKMRVVEVIENKCLMTSRSNFEYYQAYRDPESREIRTHRIRPPTTKG